MKLKSGTGSRSNKQPIANKYASVVGRTTYMVHKERKIKVEKIDLKIYKPTPF